MSEPGAERPRVRVRVAERPMPEPVPLAGSGSNKPPGEQPPGNGGGGGGRGDRERRENGPGDPYSVVLKVKLAKGDFSEKDIDLSEQGRGIDDTWKEVSMRWWQAREAKTESVRKDMGKMDNTTFEQAKGRWVDATELRIKDVIVNSKNVDLTVQTFKKLGLDINPVKILNTPAEASKTIREFIQGMYAKYYERGATIIDMFKPLTYRELESINMFAKGQLGGQYGYDAVAATLASMDYMERIRNSNGKIQIEQKNLKASGLKGDREKGILKYLRGEIRDKGVEKVGAKPAEEPKKKRRGLRGFWDSVKEKADEQEAKRQAKKEQKSNKKYLDQVAEAIGTAVKKEPPKPSDQPGVKPDEAVNPAPEARPDMNKPIKSVEVSPKQILDQCNVILEDFGRVPKANSIKELAGEPQKIKIIVDKYLKELGLFYPAQSRIELQDLYKGRMNEVTERTNLINGMIRTLVFMHENPRVREEFRILKERWGQDGYTAVPHLYPEGTEALTEDPKNGNVYINILFSQGRLRDELLWFEKERERRPRDRAA